MYTPTDSCLHRYVVNTIQYINTYELSMHYIIVKVEEGILFYWDVAGWTALQTKAHKYTSYGVASRKARILLRTYNVVGVMGVVSK